MLGRRSTGILNQPPGEAAVSTAGTSTFAGLQDGCWGSPTEGAVASPRGWLAEPSRSPCPWLLCPRDGGPPADELTPTLALLGLRSGLAKSKRGAGACGRQRSAPAPSGGPTTVPVPPAPAAPPALPVARAPPPAGGLERGAAGSPRGRPGAPSGAGAAGGACSSTAQPGDFMPLPSPSLSGSASTATSAEDTGHPGGTPLGPVSTATPSSAASRLRSGSPGCTVPFFGDHMNDGSLIHGVFKGLSFPPRSVSLAGVSPAATADGPAPRGTAVESRPRAGPAVDREGAQSPAPASTSASAASGTENPNFGG